MAETAAGNGPNGDPTAIPEGMQQILVNAQYIKDLSFENPRAPHSLMQQGTPPQVEINVDVKTQNLQPDMYEVMLTINATAKALNEPVFLVELAYGAVVTVRNVPEALMSVVLLVETPRLIFPFVRQIIADATRDGGFPPLMINPIDFGELLRSQQAGAPPNMPGGISV